MTTYKNPNKQYVNLEAELPEPEDDGTPIYSFWKNKVEVSVFTSNGIKLVGVIDWFDGEFITLRAAMDVPVFRNHIVSIVPQAGTFIR